MRHRCGQIVTHCKTGLVDDIDVLQTHSTHPTHTFFNLNNIIRGISFFLLPIAATVWWSLLIFSSVGTTWMNRWHIGLSVTPKFQMANSRSLEAVATSWLSDDIATLQTWKQFIQIQLFNWNHCWLQSVKLSFGGFCAVSRWILVWKISRNKPIETRFCFVSTFWSTDSRMTHWNKVLFWWVSLESALSRHKLSYWTVYNSFNLMLS